MQPVIAVVSPEVRFRSSQVDAQFSAVSAQACPPIGGMAVAGREARSTNPTPKQAIQTVLIGRSPWLSPAFTLTLTPALGERKGSFASLSTFARHFHRDVQSVGRRPGISPPGVGAVSTVLTNSCLSGSTRLTAL